MAFIKKRNSAAVPNQAKEAARKIRKEPRLHDQLVERAGRWLKGTAGCSVVLEELVANTASGETPDAVGWRSDFSILIECKATRGDFLADKKKRFRQDPERGIGSFRFYLCPPGLIKPEELPEGWGLLYAEERIIRKVHGPKGNSWTYGDAKNFMLPRNRDAEITMLVSAMRRKG